MDNKKVILISAVSFALAWGVCWFINKDYIKLGKKFAIIDEMEDIVKKNGKPDFDEEEAYNGALTGYFQKGADKYTYYKPNIEKDKVKLMTEYVNTAGTAIASGFLVGYNDDGNILLTEVDENLTAYEQGLRANDVIVSINGVNVLDEGYENIVNKILGKQDTVVNLKIKRDEEEFEIEFKRDNESTKQIQYEKMGDSGYIKVEAFNQFMKGGFTEALDELQECDKLIFDLRDNPGGDGDVVIDLVSSVCGKCYVEKHFYRGEVKKYESEKENKCAEKKIVVLVNENTASAAEIFTSTMMQNSPNATIIGTTTFGKGIFQEEANLSDGGKLHYTAGYFTVGDWECWQDKGIAPDIEVEMDSALIGTDEDIQLQKALELLE